MAIVPRATSQVDTKPLSGPYQSAAGATFEAFGGGNAQAMVAGANKLEQGANQVAQLAMKIKMDDDERELKDTNTEFTKQRLAILRGDGTTQNPGYLGSMGQTAIDGYSPSREALKKRQEALAEGMKSERARKMFQDVSNTQLLEDDDRMLGHVTGQRKVADDATGKARVETAASEAGLFWNDDKAIGKSIAVANAEAAAAAQRHGMSPEVADRAAVEARTTVISNAIRNAVELDPDRAQKLYVQHVGSIDGREAAVLRKLVEEKTLVDASQREADKIWAEARLKGWDEAQTMAEVRKRTTGKLQDGIVQRVNRMYSEVEQSTNRAYSATVRAHEAAQRGRQETRQQEEDAAVKAADNIIRGSATAAEQLRVAQENLEGRVLELVTNRINNNRAHLAGAKAEAQEANRTAAFKALDDGKNPDDLSPDVKASLTLGQFEQMQRTYSNRLAGFPPATMGEGWTKYAEYIAQAKDPDQARFIDLNEAKMWLGVAEYRRIAELKASADAGKLDPNANNDAGAINTMLVGMSFNTKAKQDDKQRLTGIMHSELDAARAALPGGRISDEERDKLLLYAKQKYITSPTGIGAWFSSPSENKDAVATGAPGTVAPNKRFADYLASQRGVASIRLKVDAPPPEAYLAASGYMPPAVRSGIMASLRRSTDQGGYGIANPTEADIRTVYARKIMMDGASGR